MLVHPLRGSKVQNSPDDFQTVIDRSGRLALFPPNIDPRAEDTRVDAAKGQRPKYGHQQIQLDDVAGKAPLVLVLKYILRRCLVKGPRGPDAVDLSLTGLFHYSREGPFCFFELSRASALANSPPEEALVDMPVSGSHDESGYSFASHILSPFRAGRPLRDL